VKEEIKIMSETNLRTIHGKPLSPETLAEYSQKFEQTWQDDEVTMKPTNYANALIALQSLDLTVGVIEALERRAKQQKKPLSFFLRSVLQNELVETE
jgi:hypothetical protein